MKSFLFLALLIATTTLVAATNNPITFHLQHTVQQCNHPGHLPTWCDGKEDTLAMADLSGLENTIITQLDRAAQNPDSSRIYVAEFSFSDKPIQKKMCELGKKGVSIEIYLDRGSAPDIEFTKSADCQKDPENPNLVGHLLGGFTAFPDWRLHHNKTLIVDAGDGSPLNINFSSGNLSRFGMSLHQDHWVMMTAPRSTNIARASLCLFRSLRRADLVATQIGMYANGSDFSKDPQVMSEYQNTMNRCYSVNKIAPMGDYERTVKNEGIAPFFTPNSQNWAVKAIKEQIQLVTRAQQKSQQYIWIAIEHFSKADIANLLRQAASRGVDVRIIMSSGTVTGASEVSSDAPFYEQNLKGTGIQVKFVETNPAAGGNGQQMHNKFAIFSTGRVFSGAGHYTSSGLATNFETLYLTQNKELTQQYEEYFNLLWSNAVEENYFKKTPDSPSETAN